MGGVTDKVDLGRLALSSGEAAFLEPRVKVHPIELGGQRYTAPGAAVDTRVDVSRTVAGFALRLRFEVDLEGPCMRCLEDAHELLAVDSREVDQPGGGEDLRSPYLEGDELDVASWARDALVLSLPTQIRCSPDCLGLCGKCGINLNENPGHEHEKEPDPRWAKLKELELD